MARTSNRRFVIAITSPAAEHSYPRMHRYDHSLTQATQGVTAMLAWLILTASAPAIVCVLCAAFLAYQQRPGWQWFLVLSIGAEFAALLVIANLRSFA
jgi:hypothetical protein